ncbi:alpha/beta fold hydrolase [Corynebacterium choanae]|uniref:Tripeptidyl aminopeptidase n=1 Tax=Corynebacterium choanae TaxID=1862358 RepID=A0A3G6JB65_9CORY|nr:alpha/beta hydrolase [Corynebacterium choanae]AZA13294.1 Tripeptidyl aminopeptidase precursor [Corynebacterium choanae]
MTGVVASPATATADAQFTRVDCPPTVVGAHRWCGEVAAPLSGGTQPEGATTTIGFIVSPATGTKQGTLFVNAGGPGGDAYTFVDGTFAEEVHIPRVLNEHFDIVGVQPRGMVGSTGIACDETLQPDPIQVAIEPAGFLRTACAQMGEPFLSSLTTENAARDMEAVRRALGVETINLYGLSYGTYLMSAYASLFPEHTGRIVLDSAMNPDRAWNGILADQQQPYVTGMHRMFGWIAEHDADYHLGTTPHQVYDKWVQVVTRQTGVPPAATPPPLQEADVDPASRAILPMLNATQASRAQLASAAGNVAKGAPLQAVVAPASQVVRAAIPQEQLWPDVATYLQVNLGLATPPEPTPAEIQQVELAKTFTDYTNKLNVSAQVMQTFILCNENQVAGDVTAYPAAIWTNWFAQDVLDSPPLLARSGHSCNGLRPVTKPVAVDPDRLPTRPLQFQSIWDPQTPWDQAMIIHDRYNTTLVTVNNGNHGHVTTGNAKAAAIAADYLLTGKAEEQTIDGPPLAIK